MKKIIAFGASTSRNSINKVFASFAAGQFDNCLSEILDLNEFPAPVFSVDVEKEKGIPENARGLCDKLTEADLIIISLAEHNGSYTAAFKNIFDWMSRYKSRLFEGKNLFLLSTSPGPRAGLNVMEAALKRFPRHGAIIIGHFSLPEFEKNFNTASGITDSQLRSDFEQTLRQVKESLGLI
jgi:NAD(P)H-dependent FMN reductase